MGQTVISNSASYNFTVFYEALSNGNLLCRMYTQLMNFFNSISAWMQEQIIAPAGAMVFASSGPNLICLSHASKND